MRFRRRLKLEICHWLAAAQSSDGIALAWEGKASSSSSKKVIIHNFNGQQLWVNGIRQDTEITNKINWKLRLRQLSE